MLIYYAVKSFLVSNLIFVLCYLSFVKFGIFLDVDGIESFILYIMINVFLFLVFKLLDDYKSFNQDLSE